MTKVLVIGGGFAGCCAAHLLSEKKGWQVTLVETAPFLGGGVKTFFHGGHPYTYGPRHFLTREERLFNFLNQYVPMRRIEHEQSNFTYVERDGRFYNYPFHVDDIPLMPEKGQICAELAQAKEDVSGAPNFEEYIVGSIGPTLYHKFFNQYSKKMWLIQSNTELDGEYLGWRAWRPKRYTLQTGAKAAWTGAISAFPIKNNGYDDYFEIATRNTTVRLKTTIEAYDIENYRVKIGGNWETYDLIISTSSPETIMNNAFGPLRWIGREFFKIVLPVEQAFPPNVYFLYYAGDEPYTRIVEYKKFYRYQSPSTLICVEIPSHKNKLYPFPGKKDQEIARKYFDAMPAKVFSIGRAGTYRYIDVDDIIAQCLELAEKLK